MTKASTPKSGRRSMRVLWIVPLLVASGFVVIHFGANAFPSSPPLRDRPIAALLENAVLHLRFGDCQPAQRVNIIVKVTDTLGVETGALNVSMETNFPGSLDVPEGKLREMDALVVEIDAKRPLVKGSPEKEMSSEIGLRDLLSGKPASQNGIVPDEKYSKVGRC